VDNSRTLTPVLRLVACVRGTSSAVEGMGSRLASGHRACPWCLWGTTCSRLSEQAERRPGTAAAILLVDVSRDRATDCSRIIQVKIIEFRIGVAKASGRSGLRRSPERRLRLPERREVYNVCERQDVGYEGYSAYCY
jgi:hypothetical protein